MAVLLPVLGLACCRAHPSPDGTLTRWYAKPPGMVSRITAEVLLELRFAIRRDEHDEGGAEIEAREAAPRKREVVFRIKGVEAGTRVDVDPGDHQRLGEQLLDRITSRIGEEAARLPPFVRNSAEGGYWGTVETALDALHAALEDLDVHVRSWVVQPGSARVEGRAPGDAGIEIAIVAVDAESIMVRFTASAENKESAERHVEQIKSGFQRALASRR